MNGPNLKLKKVLVQIILHEICKHNNVVPYFTAEAPTSNKRPLPILAKKSCVGLIALELAPTVNYWFKGEIEIVIMQSH